MTSSQNRIFGISLSAMLTLGGCGGSGGGFSLNGDAGAAEVANAGLAAAYLTARSAIEAGKFDLAALQLGEALSADPENAELRNQLFVLHLSSADFDNAGQIAASLMEADAATDDVKMFLALAAFKADRFDRAAELFDSIAPQGINELMLPFLRAWLQFAAGETELAIQTLDGNGDNNGLSLIRDYHKSAMFGLTDRPQEAVELLHEIVPATEPVPNRLMLQRAALDQAVLGPDSAREFLDAQSEVDGDDMVRRSAARLLASEIPIGAPIANAADGMADALQSLGRALADQGGGGQALLLAQMANFVAPDVADTRMFAAEMLLRENRTGKALEMIADRSGDPLFGYLVRLLEASIRRQQEDYEGAIRILSELAAEQPDRTDALIALGQLHSSNRDYELAELALSRAVERLGEPSEFDWRLFYSRGISFERTDRWPQAEADFQKALELRPEQPFVLNYLGYSWVDQGIHLDEATGMLRRAVELRPEDGFIVDSLGWAQYRLGNFEDAVVHLERAIELQPDDPVINDHLGDAYWQVGRKREARYQWERAKIFEPEEEVLADIEKKLANGLDAAREPG